MTTERDRPWCVKFDIPFWNVVKFCRYDTKYIQHSLVWHAGTFSDGQVKWEMKLGMVSCRTPLFSKWKRNLVVAYAQRTFQEFLTAFKPEILDSLVASILVPKVWCYQPAWDSWVRTFFPWHTCAIPSKRLTSRPKYHSQNESKMLKNLRFHAWLLQGNLHLVWPWDYVNVTHFHVLNERNEIANILPIHDEKQILTNLARENTIHRGMSKRRKL